MTYADIKYSKQLADLFPESEWCLIKTPDDEVNIYSRPEAELMYLNAKLQDAEGDSKICFSDWAIYPALTTDYLLERLPRTLENYCLTIVPDPDSDNWGCSYFNAEDREAHSVGKEDKSLPNALAKMLIWLKEEKLL